MTRSAQRCSEQLKGKLVIHIKSPIEEYANDVKVIAENDTHTFNLVSERKKKHPKYFWSEKQISGVAMRKDIPVGTYSVYLENYIDSKASATVQHKDREVNRRNPQVTFIIPVSRFQIEIKTDDERFSAGDYVFNVKMKSGEIVRVVPIDGRSFADISFNDMLDEKFTLQSIESNKQLEIVESTIKTVED